MLLSVFFALMVGSPTHPPILALDLLPHPPHRPVPCPHPPPPSGSLNAPSACASAQSALSPPLCKHCLLEAACLAAHALPPGRGMDLNPELLSAIDRLCVGLVVQCMFQCRVHNLNWGQGQGRASMDGDHLSVAVKSGATGAELHFLGSKMVQLHCIPNNL